MTTITKLLGQKEELLARLHEDPGPEERERIEELLAKINTALQLLENTGPGTGD
jgi:hypothetical protein